MNKFDEIIIQNGFFKLLPDHPVFFKVKEDLNILIAFPTDREHSYDCYLKWEKEYPDKDVYKNIYQMFEGMFTFELVPIKLFNLASCTLISDYFWHNYIFGKSINKVPPINDDYNYWSNRSKEELEKTK
jgi:hypothetical protein